MNDGLCLVACAGLDTLARTLLLLGAVAERGGSVILLTDAPGQALRQTFFGLEVVVRREDQLAEELLRLEALALARGAGVLLLDDPQLGDEHVGAVRVLSEQLAVARFGSALLGGAGGELAIDPYHDPHTGPGGEVLGDADGGMPPGPLSIGGCFGLSYLAVHPQLRALRERQRQPGGGDVPEEVRLVTVACADQELGTSLAVRTLEALGIWRPRLRITVVRDPHRPSPDARSAAVIGREARGAAAIGREARSAAVIGREARSAAVIGREARSAAVIDREARSAAVIDREARSAAAIAQSAQASRHEVLMCPLAIGSQLGEQLLCDLAIVDNPDRAVTAAYLGTPAVLLSTTALDAQRGEVLARSGVVVHVPLHGGTPAGLPQALYADILWTLCADQGRRVGLSLAARRVIDGYGADRIATALFDLNQARSGRRHQW